MPIERKVAAGGLGGAVAVILIWAFRHGTAIEVPAEVAGAFAVVCQTVVGWLVPNRT